MPHQTFVLSNATFIFAVLCDICCGSGTIPFFNSRFYYFSLQFSIWTYHIIWMYERVFWTCIWNEQIFFVCGSHRLLITVLLCYNQILSNYIYSLDNIILIDSIIISILFYSLKWALQLTLLLLRKIYRVSFFFIDHASYISSSSCSSCKIKSKNLFELRVHSMK